MAFSTADLYLKQFSTELIAAPHSQPSQANLSITIAAPIREGNSLVVISSIGVDLAPQEASSDHDEAFARLRSEYAVIVECDQELNEEWPFVIDLQELAQHAFDEAWMRHRERFMEATLRMGLAIFKLPITMPPLPSIGDAWKEEIRARELV